MVDSVAGVFVPVDVLAREQGTTADSIIEQIQSGAMVGRKQSTGWHVMVRVPDDSAQRAPQAPSLELAPVATRAEISGPITIDGVTEVVVRDVQIRFSAMVVLLLKLVIACIPVGLILGALGFAGLWLFERFGGPVMELLQLAMDMVSSWLQ